MVQEKGGFSCITQSVEWREIYSDLRIPKITQAAGHHAKNAYSKYLLSFEEYIVSFQQGKNQRESSSKSPSKKSNKLSATKQSRSVDESDSTMRRVSRRRKVSESLSVVDEGETSTPSKEVKRPRKSRVASEPKRDSDPDDASSTASSEKSTVRNKPAPESKPEAKSAGRKRSYSGAAGIKKQASYKVGDKLRVKYGRDSFKLYTAKIMDMKTDANNDAQYYVHYAGWNSRHDEWIKPWRIAGLFNEVSSLVKAATRRSKTPPFSNVKKEAESENDSLLQKSAPNSPENLPPTPTSCDSEKNEVSSIAKAFQDESKRISEKRKRMRRRSTSSSTPPPQPPSAKRASSVEKFLIDEKSEPKSPPKEDSTSGDEKVIEKSPPSGVPVGIFPIARRTSGRRSKSPAYLKESALYGLTKRKRNNSNSNNDVQSNTESDPLPVDADDVSSESSSKSFGSSTSEANRSSPLTVWTETDQSKYAERSKKSKRTKKKSGDKKLSQISEEAASSLIEKSGAYDMFDEDVPNIELERSAESGRETTSVAKSKPESSSEKLESDGSGEDSRAGENSPSSNEDQRSESSSSSASNESKESDDASESSSSQTVSEKPAEKQSEDQQEDNVSIQCTWNDQYAGRLAQLLGTSLSVQKVWGSIPGPVKSGTVSPNGRCDVSSELCWPGTKPWRSAPPLVARFGVP